MAGTFENCKLKDQCNNFGNCSFHCYPYTFLHGNGGNTGLWKTRNVPKKYEHCTKSNLPKLDPIATNDTMHRYIDNCIKHVANSVGMYLYSEPTKLNPMGTGTGKTTTACTIINDFMVKRTQKHFTGGKSIKENPTLFMKMADFQNIYNGQFRGDKATQELNSEKYYLYKNRMKKVELLVVDDIAVRSGTEAFLNEVYEIIDHRVSNDFTTIYTSNYPLKDLHQFLGERIVSRIIGSTYAYPFAGEDHRKKGRVI